MFQSHQTYGPCQMVDPSGPVNLVTSARSKTSSSAIYQQVLPTSITKNVWQANLCFLLEI